jgi:hypothetical protein
MTRAELLTALNEEHTAVMRVARALATAILELQTLAPVGADAVQPSNKIEVGLFAGQRDQHKDEG